MMMTKVVPFPQSRPIYVLEFEAKPSLLRLIDQLRGEMGRDEFLMSCMQLGITEAVKRGAAVMPQP
jgi:hypothetical protein